MIFGNCRPGRRGKGGGEWSCGVGLERGRIGGGVVAGGGGGGDIDLGEEERHRNAVVVGIAVVMVVLVLLGLSVENLQVWWWQKGDRYLRKERGPQGTSQLDSVFAADTWAYFVNRP
jgi:hypothetical protein